MIPSLIVGVLAAGSFSDDSGQPPTRPAVVLFLKDHVSVPGPVVSAALAGVIRIFGVIGIGIAWRGGKAKTRVADETTFAIQVTIEKTPAGDRRTGVAYSAPFAATVGSVWIRYDRLQDLVPHQRELDAYLLARMLAHEISHVLAGSNAHTDTGLMKAHWTREDCARMRLRPLEFTSEDVDRMRRALGERLSQQSSRAPSPTQK